MTDIEQHVWNAWLDAFVRVRDLAPGPAHVPCPSCGRGEVRVVFTGDRIDRIGYAFAWCDACLKGIHLCRVGIPEGADMLTFDTPDSEFEAIIPDFEPMQPTFHEFD